MLVKAFGPQLPRRHRRVGHAAGCSQGQPAGLALGYTMIGIGLLIALGFLLFWGVLAASVSTTGSFG